MSDYHMEITLPMHQLLSHLDNAYQYCEEAPFIGVIRTRNGHRNTQDIGVNLCGNRVDKPITLCVYDGAAICSCFPHWEELYETFCINYHPTGVSGFKTSCYDS